MLLAGGGAAGYLLFGSGDTSVAVSSTSPVADEPSNGSDPTTSATAATREEGAAAGQEGAATSEEGTDEPAEPASADPGTAESEPDPREGGSEGGSEGGERRGRRRHTGRCATSIEEIESYELERPRPNRRARRMPEAQRRRQATRLRAIGQRQYRDGEHAEAEESYRRALSFNDWDVASLEGLARAVAQQGRYPEAIAWADLAVQRNPRSAAAYRVLGDVWRQAGHPDRARRAYRQGLRRRPGDRWLTRRIRELNNPD